MVSAGSAKPAAPRRVQLVVFRAGGETYAVDVFSVERVLRYEPPRPIPNLPAWLEGVMEYGGCVVPVIDVRTRFDLPRADDRAHARIVVFVMGDERVAAIVDAVDEVATVDEAALEEPPPTFRGVARQYVRALVRRGGTVTVVLDAAQFLNPRERIVLEQATAELRNG